jgi:hypothetical protein
MSFRANQRVDIIAGSYEGRRGTYLAPAGFRGISARVCVDLDSRDYRNLRLASLQGIPLPPSSSPALIPASLAASTTGRRPVSPEPDSIAFLLDDAREIQRRVASLVLRLERITVSGHSGTSQDVPNRGS